MARHVVIHAVGETPVFAPSVVPAVNGLQQIVYLGSHNSNAVTDGKASILANLDYIDEVCPSWYCPTFAADGTVSMQPQATAVEDLDFIARVKAAGVAVRPVLANYYPGLTTSSNNWDWGPVSTILNDSTLRATLVSNIVDLVDTKGYSGIDIDFEHPNRVGSTNTNTAVFKSTDRAVLVTFIGELATALHAIERTVAVTWPAKTSLASQDAWDHYLLGQAADQCRIMIYDDYGYGSTPFPPAGLAWWESAATFTAGQVPAHKLVLGAANYGFIWTKATGASWDTTTTANPIDTVWTELQTLFASVSETITTEDGMKKAEWVQSTNDKLAYYEDASTLSTKAAVAKKFYAAGMHYWRAGHEDPDSYADVETVLDATGTFSMDLSPTADTTIDAGATAQDRSSTTTLQVKVSNERRALLRFIIPELPAGATISSAVLSLRRNALVTAEASGRTYEVDRLTQTFARTGANVNNATSGVSWTKSDIASNTSWSTAGGDYVTTDAATAIVPATNGTWMTWTITALVEWAAANGGELPLIIRDVSSITGTGHGTLLDSMDASTATNRPKLTITWTLS